MTGISLNEARALIQQEVKTLPAQRSPLSHALRRVLRKEIVAPDDQPAFDRSAMDGYAIDSEDSSSSFRVVAEIQPGHETSIQLHAGECARIFTGAPIPSGANQIIMQEEVRVTDQVMSPLSRDKITNIRRRGEDARKGDVLLGPGAPLRAGDLALLASIGEVSPAISPLSRVAHLVTGNELVAPSEQPRPGEIRDSNSTLVSALVDQAGGRIVAQEVLADDYRFLLGKAKTLPDWDLLLISGGASVGNYDYGKRLLEELGFTVHFEKLHLRPGKPLIFATREGKPAFVLPGNPVSHFVVFHVAVRLAMEHLIAAEPSFPIVSARLAEDFKYRPDARETFWPAVVKVSNGELIATPKRWQSSGDLAGLAGANALLHITSPEQPLHAGAKVECLLVEPL